jgi:hypothetical protein
MPAFSTTLASPKPEMTNVPDIGRMTTLKDMSAAKKQVVSQLEIIGEIDAGVPATIIRFFVAKIGLDFVKIFKVCPGTFMSADAVIKYRITNERL